MSDHPRGSGLSQFQLDLARVFFALPESVGFLLAGGGALIAHGLVARDTDDLDFFTARRGEIESPVAAAGEALIATAAERGWVVETVRSGPEFRRLKISRGADALPTDVGSGETVYVDLAVDSPPSEGATFTVAGPALAPQELAVRKTLALFGRAEPRDFTDVYVLHQQFDRAEILRAATDADPGFDLRVFVQMLRSHRRLRDEDFPETGVPVENLRAYYDNWTTTLEQAE